MREGETQEPCEKRDSRPEPMVPGGFVVSGRGWGKMFLKNCVWFLVNYSTLFSSKEVCPMHAFSCLMENTLSPFLDS